MVSGAAAWASLGIAVPLGLALILLSVGRWLPRPVVDTLAIAGAAANCGLAVWLLTKTGASGRAVTWVGGWQPVHRTGVGIPLVIDPVGAGAGLLAAILAVCGLVYSWRYMEAVEAHYQALMLLFLAGMTGFVYTGDVFDMFVFFELMGAAAYALTGLKVEDASAVEGAFNFGVINSLGAYFSLFGIGLLYARTGELGLAQLHEKLGHSVDALVVTGICFVLTGLLVKAAMVPFHFWLDDAHAVAPTPVCILFSGVMVELGLYGAARVYTVAFSGVIPPDDMRRAFLVLGTVTALVGAVMCWQQRHLKRLLAFSTIGHVGLFAVAIGMWNPDGAAGAVTYVLGHAGVKAALFLVAGILLNRFETVDERTLYGQGRGMWVSGTIFLLGGLALAGLPPFGAGLGKSLAETASSDEGYTYTLALFVIVSAVTGAAVLRAGMRIFLGWGPRPEMEKNAGGETSGDEEEPETKQGVTRRVRLIMAAPAIALLLGSLLVGVLPALHRAIGGAATTFVDGTGYVAAALQLPHSAVTGGQVPTGWTGEGILLGLVSTAVAVLGAAQALSGEGRRGWYRRVPPPLEPARKPAVAALAGLRALHSGHIGDYVAWLVLGVVALTALVGVPLT
jgi:multicomponent Na+:H+ antiporter subunit D